MHPLLEPILALHRRIRADVVASCERAAVAALSDVAHDDEGDTIYAIDRVAEDVLVDEIERTIASARRQSVSWPRAFRAARWCCHATRGLRTSSGSSSSIQSTARAA